MPPTADGPPGPRRLPLAEVKAALQLMIDETLALIPASRRAEAAEEFAKILDGIDVRAAEAGEAKAGETILFGEAARDEIAAAIVEVAEMHERRLREL